MKNCCLAWPEHSSIRALMLSAYTESNNTLHGREVWLVSCSQPLFLWTTYLMCTKSVESAGKMGWLCEIRSGHTRLEERQLKKGK